MQEAGTQQTINDGRIREQIRETIEQARIMQEEAQAAGVGQAPVGTAITQVPPPWPDDIPPRLQDTAIALFLTFAAIIIGYPIARALGRRIDRTGTSPKIPSEVTSQLAQLNQAVEAIAIEVERISEGQRFTTKLLSEQRQLPSASRNVS